jgi:hypothetical protein
LYKLVAFPATKPEATFPSSDADCVEAVENKRLVQVMVVEVAPLSLKFPAEFTVTPVGATRAVTGNGIEIKVAVVA